LRIAVGALLAGLALSGAAQAGGIDKAKLAEARSLAAEAATVEALQARGKLTAAYAEGLRDDLRKDLDKLSKEPELGDLVKPAIAALDAHDAAALGAVRDRLVALERIHGRAS
jgi:hypothetical protein